MCIDYDRQQSQQTSTSPTPDLQPAGVVDIDTVPVANVLDASADAIDNIVDENRHSGTTVSPEASSLHTISGTSSVLLTATGPGDEKDCQCCSGDEPNQPSKSDFDYSLTARRYGSQVRKMDPGWYDKWKWLSLCKQRLAVMCTQCRWMNTGNRWPPGIKVEAAFTSKGFSSWQVASAKFGVHEKSDAHALSMSSWMRRSHPTAATLVDLQYAANQTDRTASLTDQLSSLQYLARQGLALRGHTEDEGNLQQLLKLRSHDLPRLTKWLEIGRYMSHDIVNEQLHLLAMEVLRPLLNQIRLSPCFSIIADETRDLSGHEQFSISIRWIDSESEVREDFIGVADVQNTDSATLSGVINDVLIRCNLDHLKLVGQAYDGASNMSGRFTGVAARITADYPAAMYIHCNNHCLQLCVEDAGSESKCVQEALNLCTNLYNLIKLSPKRLAVFENIQLHQESNSSLKPLCPTRWTVRAAAISSVLSSYEALQETLDVVIEENRRGEMAAKASGIMAQMEKFHTVFGLHIAKLVFTATDQAATSLQGKDITAAEATGVISSLKKHLSTIRDSFDAVWCDIVKYAKKMDITVTVPRQRKLSRKLDDTRTQHMFSADVPEDYYKQQYFAVIDAIRGELENRFSQSSMERLAYIETVLLDAANGRLLRSGSGRPFFRSIDG
jgi:hypothetical protein